MTMIDDEPGGLSVQLFGKLDATLGGLGARFDQWRDEDRMYRRIVEAGLLSPATSLVQATSKYPSSGSLVLDVGGPAPARRWDVMRLVIGGQLPSTTAAGVADIYVSAAPQGALPTSLLDWADQAATLPLNAFYSHGQVFVRYPEHLFIVIRSGTSAQEYLAGAFIVDSIDSPAIRASETVGP